jgi:hypothetical protein
MSHHQKWGGSSRARGEGGRGQAHNEAQSLEDDEDGDIRADVRQGRPYALPHAALGCRLCQLAHTDAAAAPEAALEYRPAPTGTPRTHYAIGRVVRAMQAVRYS